MLLNCNIFKIYASSIFSFAVILLVLLSIAHVSGATAINEKPKIINKIDLPITDVAFNSRKNIVYGCTNDTLYVFNAQNQVIRKVQLLAHDNYMHFLRFVAYNPRTNKIYLAEEPSTIIVLNGNNYSVIKKLELSLSENPNSWINGITVDSSENMVYLDDFDTYCVINGENDTFLRVFHFKGALDLRHHYLWSWSRDVGYGNYYIVVRDLSNMSVVREIKTPVPFNDSGWVEPQVNVFGSYFYVENYTGYTYVYSTDNYSLVNNFTLKEGTVLKAFDAKYNVLYSQYISWSNKTGIYMGVSMVDSTTGKILSSLPNLTYNDGNMHLGTLYIVGVSPGTHLVYVAISSSNNTHYTKYLLACSFVAEQNKSSEQSYSQNPMLMKWVIAGAFATMVALIVIIYAIHRKNKK